MGKSNSIEVPADEPGPTSTANPFKVAMNIRQCSSTKEQISLSYTTDGDPSHPALMLVTGLNTNFMMYDDDFVARLVKEGFFVIRFDNRDVGYSTKFTKYGDPNLVMQAIMPHGWSGVKTVYTLEDMADDAVALLDYLKVDKVHMFGISMGGMISQQVAIRHPHRVLTLTSAKSTTGAHDLPAPSFGIQKKMVQGPPVKPSMPIEEQANAVGYWLVEVIWPEGSVKDEANIKWQQQNCLKLKQYCNFNGGNQRQLTAILQSQPRDELLKKCPVPGLVIHGKLDKLVPVAHGERTAKCLNGAVGGGCQTLIMDDMAHNVHPKYYDRWIAALKHRVATAAAARAEKEQEEEAQ